MKYTYNTFFNARARRKISKIESRRISIYKSKDITNLLNQNTTSDNSYWKILTELTQMLFHHPSPIARHEASFVLGAFNYRNEVEKNNTIYNLRIVMRSDPSIVAKHEATEALGDLHSMGSVGAAADMAKILRFKRSYHPDIVATAEEAFENIMVYLEKKGNGYRSVVRELKSWKTIKK